MNIIPCLILAALLCTSVLVCAQNAPPPQPHLPPGRCELVSLPAFDGMARLKSVAWGNHGLNGTRLTTVWEATYANGRYIPDTRSGNEAPFDGLVTPAATVTLREFVPFAGKQVTTDNFYLSYWHPCESTFHHKFRSTYGFQFLKPPKRPKPPPDEDEDEGDPPIGNPPTTEEEQKELCGKPFVPGSCRPFPPDRRLEPEEAVPAPGEIILVAENITHHRRKFGFVTYIPQPEGELPAYYLTQNIEQHLVGGNPESPVGGTVTENVCVTDGAVIEVARQGNVSYYGLPAIDDPNATQTTWAAQWRVTSYDDCPNQEHDEPGTMVASASLSDLHTTARFKEDTFQNAWYYKGYYKKEAPVAELLLPDEENIISYSKTRYSVRIGEEVPLPCKVLVMEEFTLEDDGDETTTEKKEYRSRQVTITDGTESQSYEIDPATEPEKEGTWRVFLLPVEVAPEVLAVNSDFDEGRIDPATGYAIPDCDDIPGVDPKTGAGNTLMALEAVRPHLDGTYAQNQRVTNNLHKGWFGVNPKTLGDDFWDGANVTIRKIDKIDDDTGHPESGQVRFYAKWGEGPSQYRGIPAYDPATLAPANLVTGGINGVPSESVYGSNSIIPENAEFYMEGVRPGKITLEWRLQKGTIDVKHEQTFRVETRKTVAEWQEEVRYQIRLQTKVKTGTEVDIAQYDTGNGFRNANAVQDNVLRVVAIYDYYQQLFKQMPEKFMWAGMAKVAAAPIYAGMSDLHTWWVNSGWFPRPEPRGFLDPGIQIFIKGLLLGGQKNIFTDKAWAHRAYKASGIGALNYLSQDFPDATNFESWKLMDEGIFANDQNKIFEANGRLLRREQQEVVQQNYDVIQNLWIYQPPAHPNINGGVWVAVNSEGLSNAGEWLSANSNNNPLPGGPGFRTTFPGGRLDFFSDRWAWTSNAANGMLEIWTGASTSVPGYDAGRRASENGKTIKEAATNYSYDPAGIP